MQASATRSAASVRATFRAASAIVSRFARVSASRRAASAAGVSSRSAIFSAAPASTRNWRWRSARRRSRGQRHDDRPDASGGELGDRDRAAAAEHEIGVRVLRGHVVDEGDAGRGDAGAFVGGAQRPDVPRAGLMHDLRAPLRGHHASAAGTRRFSAAAPRLPPTTSRCSGPVRSANRDSGGGCVRSHRAADCRPLDFGRMPATHRSRKPEKNPVGTVGKHAVRESGDRVRVVQHQRLGQRHARERTGERCETAQTQHDIRGAPADDPAALPQRRKQGERTETIPSSPCRGCRRTTRPRSRHRAGVRARPPCRPWCRARTRASPGRSASRQPRAREDMTARAARSDHHGAGHTVKPLRSLRFWLRPAARAALTCALRKLADAETGGVALRSQNRAERCDVIP